MEYDLVIKNALIIDGTGEKPFRGAIFIKNGTITDIIKGDICCDIVAKDIYDAQQNILAPGFIDIHCHTDETIFKYPYADSKILQGVTTDIGGNCGISYAPMRDESLELLESYVGNAPFKWNSFGELLEYYDSIHPSVNLACGVGHGTLRIAAMGFDARKANKREMDDMKAMLSEAFDEGAFFLSSGLIYPPGIYADRDEIVDLCKIVSKQDAYYATHMRDEGINIIKALEEAISTAKESEASLEVSHHKLCRREVWRQSKDTISMIDNARSDGIDVWADQYPYNASSTYLSSNIPSWAFEGGINTLQQRLLDKNIKSKILAEMDESHLNRWQDITLGYSSSTKYKNSIGKNMEEIAASLGCTASEACIDIILEDGNDALEVNYGMCEEDIKYIMKQPYVSICSDGWAYSMDYAGLPHPRSFGSFPRVLSHYCRERKLFPLEEAIYKMTGLPASRAGLNDRGTIKKGNWADLVVFDPLKIKDDPSYLEPKKPCSGINRVYVNGILTAKNGRHTKARAGSVLRKSKNI